MAFNDESMCFVASTRLSVADNQILCWPAERFPMKKEATVQTISRAYQPFRMHE
jgi:hypothetical protein